MRVLTKDKMTCCLLRQREKQSQGGDWQIETTHAHESTKKSQDRCGGTWEITAWVGKLRVADLESRAVLRLITSEESPA